MLAERARNHLAKWAKSANGIGLANGARAHSLVQIALQTGLLAA